MSGTAYKRVLLKLSGEALLGEERYGIDPKVAQALAQKIKSIHIQGIEIALVVGGGNIWRGFQAASSGMDRSTADYMGMLATVFNALALQDALEQNQVMTRVMTAIQMHQIAEPYIRRRAIRHLEKGRVVILAGGNGLPYFSTDTTAALRSMEIGAEVILMQKNEVEGVYDSDPRTNPEARKYDELSFTDAINKNLKVMDSTALTMCRDNNMPIIVMTLDDSNLEKAVLGQKVGTYISRDSVTKKA
jgi:uridylate kinase